jgi:hypothetical protein
MASKELLKTVGERENQELKIGWAHSFIGQHLDVLQQHWSFPQEDAPMAIL